jgi:hypothetical protein
MADKKEWKDYTPREKKVGMIIIGVLSVLLLLILGSIVASINDGNKRAAVLAQKVQNALDGLSADTKKSLSSTSAAGYQGEIVSVDPDSSNSVKVNVSTYFKEPGDEKDGGKNIAENIFYMICSDIPELQSLYVSSSSSGLDSRSVYRDVSCK